MGSLASREYDQKKLLTSKSPGPVYNVKKGTTSNRPPPKICTLKTRHTNQEDKESKITRKNSFFFFEPTGVIKKCSYKGKS